MEPVFMNSGEKQIVIETVTGLLLSLKPYCDKETAFAIEKTLVILDNVPVDTDNEGKASRDSLSEKLGMSSLKVKRRRESMNFAEFIQACNKARVEKEMEKKLKS